MGPAESALCIAGFGRGLARDLLTFLGGRSSELVVAVNVRLTSDTPAATTPPTIELDPSELDAMEVPS